MKKFISILLATVLCLGSLLSLTSCNLFSDEGKAPKNSIEVVSNGTSDYVIVYGADQPDWALECAELLQSDFANKFGITLEIVTDETAAADNEIILGTTTRAENATIATDEIQNGYDLFMSGNKIVIGAACEKGLKTGISYFLTQITEVTLKNEENASLYVAEALASKETIEAGKFDIGDKTDVVSICYSIWFDYILDMYPNPKIIQDCLDGVTKFGSYGEFHYWAKPAQGFYKSTDKTATRNNMLMLEAAGIDFIILDMTNGECGHSSTMINRPLQTLCDVIHELLAEGYDAPRVVVWGREEKMLDKIITNFYTEENEDIFVYWDGEPLLIDYGSGYTHEGFRVENMTGLCSTDDGTWSFLNYPNSVAYDEDGNPEQVVCCCAVQRDYMSSGSAYGRRGGLTFFEEWQLAFDVHPKIVTVTWWNEFAVQRYDTSSSGHGNFTDNYTEAFSRDIEPTEGGHGATYYEFLCSYVKAYKNHEDCPVNLQGGQGDSVKWDFSGENGTWEIMTMNDANMTRKNTEDLTAVYFTPFSKALRADPYFMLNATEANVDASEYNYFAMTYMMPAENSDTSKKKAYITVSCGDTYYSDGIGSKVEFQLIADGEYHTIYLDISQIANYIGKLNTIRVDFASSWEYGDMFYLKSAELTNQAE